MRCTCARFRSVKFPLHSFAGLLLALGSWPELCHRQRLFQVLFSSVLGGVHLGWLGRACLVSSPFRISWGAPLQVSWPVAQFRDASNAMYQRLCLAMTAEVASAFGHEHSATARRLGRPAFFVRSAPAVSSGQGQCPRCPRARIRPAVRFAAD